MVHGEIYNKQGELLFYVECVDYVVNSYYEQKPILNAAFEDSQEGLLEFDFSIYSFSWSRYGEKFTESQNHRMIELIKEQLFYKILEDYLQG